MELRKVAQSPLEPPLHRSAVQVSPHSGDTHRGGEARPDTFQGSSKSFSLASIPKPESESFREEANAESTSDFRHRTSDIKLNFGLVDPDQDMGAGEGTSSLQPAPSPVLSNQIKQELARQAPESQSLVSNVLCLASKKFPSVPVLSNQINSGREALSQSTEAKSLASCVLSEVEACILRPESSSSLVSNVSCAELSPSARLQSFHPDSTFLFLRFELEGIPTQTPTKLSVSLSSQELDARHDYLHTVEDSMTLSSGDFLSGTMGLQLGEMKIPFSTGIGRLRLKLDSQTLLQDIWVQPNDSLRVTVDASTGKVLFLGPHKDKFRLQIQLQDLAAAWTKSINPIMLTSNKERILDSPDKRDYYQKMAEIQAAGWNRRLELLAEDSERLARARFLLSSGGEDHPVFQELKRYQEELGPDFFNWLWLFWKGKLKKQALDYMVLTQASSPEWGQLLLGYALEDEELSRIKALEEFPMEFAEALYIENFLLEIYSGIAFVHLTDALPAPLQSQVNAFYLVRQYKELTAPDSMISALIEKSSSPWIRKYLQGILNGNLTGSQFINEPFWNEQGELVYPESWKGKLVFLDFWLSGCGACLAFAKNKFHPLLEEFGTHPDILFVTITGDSDRELWKSSLSKNLFTTASAQNLYAAGVTHPALRQYHIQSFPEQMLLDREGKILQVGGFPNDLEGWKQLLRTYLKQDNLSTQILTHLQSN